MSKSENFVARTHRFNAVVRGFTPPSPTRHAELMLFKDGIVELWQNRRRCE